MLWLGLFIYFVVIPYLASSLVVRFYPSFGGKK